MSPRPHEFVLDLVAKDQVWTDAFYGEFKGLNSLPNQPQEESALSLQVELQRLINESGRLSTYYRYQTPFVIRNHLITILSHEWHLPKWLRQASFDLWKGPGHPEYGK